MATVNTAEGKVNLPEGMTLETLAAIVAQQAETIARLEALKTPRDSEKTAFNKRKAMYKDLASMVQPLYGTESDAFRLACALRAAHLDSEPEHFDPVALDAAANKAQDEKATSPGGMSSVKPIGFRWVPVLERWRKYPIPEDFDVSDLTNAAHVMAAIEGRLNLVPADLEAIREAYRPRDNMVGAPEPKSAHATSTPDAANAALDDATKAAADAAADMASEDAPEAQPAKLPKAGKGKRRF